jgi:hypothetical protein
VQTDVPRRQLLLSLVNPNVRSRVGLNGPSEGRRVNRSSISDSPARKRTDSKTEIGQRKEFGWRRNPVPISAPGESRVKNPIVGTRHNNMLACLHSDSKDLTHHPAATRKCSLSLLHGVFTQPTGVAKMLAENCVPDDVDTRCADREEQHRSTQPQPWRVTSRRRPCRNVRCAISVYAV